MNKFQLLVLSALLVGMAMGYISANKSVSHEYKLMAVTDEQMEVILYVTKEWLEEKQIYYANKIDEYESGDSFYINMTQSEIDDRVLELKKLIDKYRAFRLILQ